MQQNVAAKHAVEDALVTNDNQLIAAQQGLAQAN